MEYASYCTRILIWRKWVRDWGHTLWCVRRLSISCQIRADILVFYWCSIFVNCQNCQKRGRGKIVHCAQNNVFIKWVLNLHATTTNTAQNTLTYHQKAFCLSITSESAYMNECLLTWVKCVCVCSVLCVCCVVREKSTRFQHQKNARPLKWILLLFH